MTKRLKFRHYLLTRKRSTLIYINKEINNTMQINFEDEQLTLTTLKTHNFALPQLHE